MTRADLPSSVEIVEVGPRDGLQDEAVTVSTADKVAFVRFASVYRDFKDVDQFMATLKGLLENREPGAARDALAKEIAKAKRE